MKIKKLSKTSYEIETKEDLIYITKEKNPSTKDLYLYFIDIFDNNACIIPTEMSDVFDEFWESKEYLQNNFQIPTKITDQIKFGRN